VRRYEAMRVVSVSANYLISLLSISVDRILRVVEVAIPKLRFEPGFRGQPQVVRRRQSDYPIWWDTAVDNFYLLRRDLNRKRRLLLPREKSTPRSFNDISRTQYDLPVFIQISPLAWRTESDLTIFMSLLTYRLISIFV
jgi:hypothetical protein